MFGPLFLLFFSFFFFFSRQSRSARSHREIDRLSIVAFVTIVRAAVYVFHRTSEYVSRTLEKSPDSITFERPIFKHGSPRCRETKLLLYRAFRKRPLSPRKTSLASEERKKKKTRNNSNAFLAVSHFLPHRFFLFRFSMYSKNKKQEKHSRFATCTISTRISEKSSTEASLLVEDR